MFSRNRFVTLDGMRGLAAVIVAAAHIGELLGLGVPAHAGLAVDFFFVLSGFVIAHAYELRLGSSMTPLEFVRARIIRLHPLILLGSSITLAILLARSSAEHGAGFLPLLWASVAGMLLIPYHQLPWPEAFPLNGPAWSLFAEYAVNILFAVIAASLTVERLRRLLLIGAAMLVLLLTLNGTVGNLWRMETIGLSLFRVIYPFFAGVALNRFYRAAPHLFPKVPSGLPILVLLAILLAPSTRFDMLFDLVMIVAAFPLLVFAAVRDSLGARQMKLMLWGGALSYPIYMLHFPLAHLLVPTAAVLFPSSWAAAALVAIMLCVIAASHLALRHFDEPVRGWLARSLSSREPRGLPA